MGNRIQNLSTLLGIVLVAAPGTLAAQEEDQTAIYASYYECAPGSIEDAVQNLEENWSPIMQAQIDAGNVLSWGAATHVTGNHWSLILYHAGPGVSEVTGAIDAGVQELYGENPESADSFSEACPAHEDYVWMSGLSSEPIAESVAERPAAAMSVYYVCDTGMESAADLIFEHTMADAWDAQVQAGLINGWSWNEHYLGGEYRRLLALDGADHASLLEARNNVIEAGAENPGLAAAFSEICFSHQDNLYDVRISRP